MTLRRYRKEREGGIERVINIIRKDELIAEGVGEKPL